MWIQNQIKKLPFFNLLILEYSGKNFNNIHLHLKDSEYSVILIIMKLFNENKLFIFYIYALFFLNLWFQWLGASLDLGEAWYHSSAPRTQRVRICAVIPHLNFSSLICYRTAVPPYPKLLNELQKKIRTKIADYKLKIFIKKNVRTIYFF